MRIKHFYLEETGENGDPSGVAGDPPADPPAGDPPADPPAGDPPATPPPAPDWPDDWRAKLDKEGKHAKTLERFASPNALLDSYMSLRQKVDSGELKAVTPYPDKGKPEEQVAWRKAHGIPEKAEDYSLKLAEGLVIGEVDKPFVDDFLKVAHGANATPEQVNQLLGWYYTNQEKALMEQADKDSSYLAQSEDTLHQEWGGEYRVNVNIIKGLVDTMPADVRDLFVNSRLGDGTVLMNHPDIARWLLHTGRTINPMATVVPGAGANVSGAIDDEITSIEKMMKENRKAYNSDPKIQARLRDLYNARERAK